MSHSAVAFPPSYPAFELLPEGEDYWFTVEELVAFIHYNQPRYNWGRLLRAWPWRWEDGDQKFSAYAVWRRLNEKGNQYLMPVEFRAYFEAKAAAQRDRIAQEQIAA